MKKKFFLLLLLVSALLTGFGASRSAFAAQAQADGALGAYAEVLDQVCDVIYNGLREDELYPYVSGGVMESVFYQDRRALLRGLGYLLDDLSGDGVPELLIGTIPEADGAESAPVMIYSGFTLRDGEPVCFLEGWARNSYQWLGGGRFFHFGSGGAMSTAFGSFRLSPDGTALSCEEQYFTAPRTPESLETAYFYNTSGLWDPSVSEELDLSPEAFWALVEDYRAEAKTPELTPFADYDFTGFVTQPLSCRVRADYLDDVSWKYAHYDDASPFLTGGAAYEVMVLFQAEEDTAEFSLLALNFRDIDAEGHAHFDIETVFRIPKLRAGVPLAAPMSFPGDIPSNGFSYKDPDGTVKSYALSMSGRDGSLVVSPLD